MNRYPITADIPPAVHIDIRGHVLLVLAGVFEVCPNSPDASPFSLMYPTREQADDMTNSLIEADVPARVRLHIIDAVDFTDAIAADFDEGDDADVAAAYHRGWCGRIDPKLPRRHEAA